MTNEQIAEVCHEAVRVFCAKSGEEQAPAWTYLTPDHREFLASGVDLVRANPAAPDSALHDFWCDRKREDGWQPGPVKDADGKTHPRLVPFDQLPIAHRTKDRLFRAIARALF